MDNYGLTMKGPFIAQIIENIGNLSYTAGDAGRVIFDQATGKLHFGDSVASAFRLLSDIPKDSVIIFETNTQMVGYTLLTDETDGVVYYTDGSGGQLGGGPKVGGAWDQPTHTHTGPLHNHGGAPHTHDLSNHAHTVAAHSHYIQHTHNYSGTTSYEIVVGSNYATTGDNAHYHTYSGTTTAASRDYTDNASPATGGPNYNATGGATYSGDTGASGNTATSASASANTWRPKGRNFTRQRRN